MQQVVLRFGLFSSIAILILAAIHLFLLNNLDFETQEVIGYLTMLLSMVFVFLGIRHYRNTVGHGYLTFGQGLKVGFLIVLLPALAFGLFDVLYTSVINPEWSDTYFSHAASKIRATTPPEKLDKALESLQSQKEFWENPLFQFVLMFATVLALGMIVAIISALTLRKKKLATSGI